MSDEYKVNKSKLSFKGESKTKKKKRKAENPADEEDSNANANADGWVHVKALSDLGGPIFLTFSSDPPTSLSIDDKSTKVIMRPIESDSPSSSSSATSLDQAEPTVVQQVFVATMLPDSNRMTLKASNGRYLSSDKFGIVSADTEAIGMQEEWTAILKPEENGGIALQSHYGKFLSVDEVAAERPGSSLGFQIRADSEVIGFCELFQAKIQAKYRKKAKKTKEVQVATKDYEFEQSRKFQTWNHGRVVVSDQDIRELDKAKKQGRFSEALLDRREKVKSDRYCK
ncbi:hypothetical protein BG006_006780 [Podila minutissima]|uniref:Actin-bundling protein n=1 Tax=Podila minutissima TaxID=64525 RepID=A0A9P5SSN6_9FUNG|nr:hypothetical protein BG006_006780 [Podila minutissima]